MHIKQIWSYIPEHIVPDPGTERALGLNNAQTKVLEKIHGLKQVRQDRDGDLTNAARACAHPGGKQSVS